MVDQVVQGSVKVRCFKYLFATKQHEVRKGKSRRNRNGRFWQR